MSNLGWYQIMTTLAKKVGGPKRLALLIATGGYAVIRLGEAGVTKVVRNIHVEKKAKNGVELKEYVVKKEGTSNEGVMFNVGNTFRVLEADGDAVLVEIVGDDNNPYFVDAGLLKEISDYRK